MIRRAELRAKVASATENRLWWTWRFLESVLLRTSTGDAVERTDQDLAVDCFISLAVEDPLWAIERIGEHGPAGHKFAMLLRDDRLDGALARVPAEQAVLRAHMIVACAHWKHPREANGELWQRAWSELERVPLAERDGDWRAAALSATAYVAYPIYRDLITERLAGDLADFWRATTLAEAIPFAARHADWPTFDEWVAQYRSLHPSYRRDHSECAVMNLEGIRALDEGRFEDAERIFDDVLALAPSLEFLSNPEVSSLAKRMRAEGRALAVCDEFDAITKKRDWRLRAETDETS